LRLVRQALIAKHQNGIAVHACLDRRHLIARERLRDIHAG